MKHCSRCKTEKQDNEFYKFRNIPWGNCKTCHRRDSRKHSLKKVYGLSVEDYERMVKEQTLTSIDDELKKKAKQLGINLSALLENSIKKQLNIKEVEISLVDGEKCFWCGRVERKATADDLNGLSWLWPDERWICSSCLKRESARIAV